MTNLGNEYMYLEATRLDSIGNPFKVYVCKHIKNDYDFVSIQVKYLLDEQSVFVFWFGTAESA
jgi:hypothetical protein